MEAARLSGYLTDVVYRKKFLSTESKLNLYNNYKILVRSTNILRQDRLGNIDLRCKCNMMDKAEFVRKRGKNGMEMWAAQKKNSLIKIFRDYNSHGKRRLDGLRKIIQHQLKYHNESRRKQKHVKAFTNNNSWLFI